MKRGLRAHACWFQRDTVTPEMRAEFSRLMADAPSHTDVVAGLSRVYRSALRIATARAVLYMAEELGRLSGATDELEFYGGADELEFYGGAA